MNYSNYDEVINGSHTYSEIGKRLMEGKSVIIGWSDEEFTHFDIFLSIYNTKKYGILQRGIKDTDLFVGIVGHSFFGFKTDDVKEVGYYEEKLNLNHSECSIKLAELLNKVIKQIKRYEA